MIAGKKLNIILHTFFILMGIACLFPIILTISISFSSNASIVNDGYSLIPKEWSLEAYSYIFDDAATIFKAYGITIFNTIVGVVVSTIIMALYAYPISRKDFKFRKFFTYFITFTLLFHGGRVSWYMVCTTMYGLSNSIWSMVLPYLMAGWHVIVLRTFFATGVPTEILESGSIDGAGEYRIFFQLVLPISLPGIASVALFQTIYYWNDWYLPTMFIVDADLYNLQFLLQQMMQNIQQMNQNPEFMQHASASMLDIPKEGARMALCVVAMGPILIAYPFFQKYFIEGLTVGSVKG